MLPLDVSRRTPRVPRKVTISLAAGWSLIAIKCVIVPNLMVRWQVPVDPRWVIVPTLILASVVTILVLMHDWSREAE